MTQRASDSVLPQQPLGPSPDILFVDDELPVLRAMKRLARHKTWNIHCASCAEEGLQILAETPMTVVVSDMRMPGMDGAEFLTRVRKLQPNSERVLMTGYADVQALEKVVNDAKIFNFLPKPWDDKVLMSVISNAIHVQQSERERERLEQLTTDQNRRLGKIALSLNGRVKEKDIEVTQALSLLEIEHKRAQNRTTDLLKAISHLLSLSGKGDGFGGFVVDTVVAIAEALDMPKGQIEQLRLAGLLHNIGSLALSDCWRYSVISSLQGAEQKRHQAQLETAESVISGMAELANVGEIMAKHKEHLNGTGYPRGLLAKDIPLAARILCVVTEYVLLHEGRRVIGVRGYHSAKEYLEQNVGEYYDVRVTTALFDVVGEDTLIEESTILTKGRRELKPGMVLAEDIRSIHNALLLLRSGTVLSQGHINKLRRYEFSTGDQIGIRVYRGMSAKRV